jgi:arylsulfatase
MKGSRDFATDRWSLFHLGTDFAEARDVADQNPDVVRRLEQQWFAEAGRHHVLPLADTLMDRIAVLVPPAYPPRPDTVLYPDGGPVTDEALPHLFGGGSILAEADVPAEGANGVLFALGNWTGGLAAYVIDGALTVAVAAPGDAIRVTARQRLAPGRHTLGLALRPGPGGVDVDVVIDNAVAATGHGAHSLPFTWQHGGTALTLGYARGLPVCDDYRPPFPWTGVLHQVRVTAGRQEPPEPGQIRVALHTD